MYYTTSKEFFEIPVHPPQPNTLKARFLCLKDFFKRCLIFPFALVLKACKTIFRVLGTCFSLAFVLVTFGTYSRSREIFVSRVSSLAKDIADWILLPFAIIVWVFRLILAVLIHPNLYFNGLA